jgi:cell division septation protein DedD
MPEEVEEVLAEQAASPPAVKPQTVAAIAAPEPQAQPAPSAPSRTASGWKIQLAAVPSEKSALEILSNARSKAPQVLADASPYTETVVKEDVTLYRARFAGFAGKEDARAACAHLTKKEFACLALRN